MKTFPLLFVALLLLAIACHAQPAPPAQPSAAVAKNPVNYLIRVEWREPKGDPKFLEVLTTEGRVQLDSIQKNSVKINNNDIPVTLRLTGTLNALNDEKGRLQLFLGRTVPYVTGTTAMGSSTSSSYQQMSVGLDSTFMVQFGKPVIIQTDENGQISVLVKRIEM